MLYLDHAATTLVRPEVREAMAPFLNGDFGNPSGVHAVARRAKNAMEEARERAAALLGAERPLEIVFTGGGTEADNLGVAGPVIGRPDRPGVVTSAIEHEAVLETVSFLERLGHPVTVVPVDALGVVSASEVAEAVDATTAVVSVMAANNETGALQPVGEVASAVRAVWPDVLIHTDAVQAFIAEEITVAATAADLITVASHKLGGPKGVGLLYVRDGVELEPVVHGGGQELGRRSGTHDVAGIVGMVTAMELSVADRVAFRDRVAAARDSFERRLADLVPGTVVNGPRHARLPQHSHLRMPGIPVETLLIRLDQAGIAAAAGSACHSGAVEISHVLAAMGMTDAEAAECIRFTFGWVTEPGDGPRAAELVAAVVEEMT